MKLNLPHHIIFLFLAAALFPVQAQVAEKPNIIFIYIDDLNDYPGAFGGHPQAETPGIDRIASWGTSFLNTHASSPKCGPSRTSMLTGKDVYYTQVYNNPGCKPFRDYFTPADGNDEVITLPEHLKNNGYFTYGINKIYHCFDTYPDLDTIRSEPCDKTLSWNKYSMFYGGDDPAIINYGTTHKEGVNDLAWSHVPDSMEYLAYDRRSVDSALLFIQEVNDGIANTCGNPFFIAIGLRKPHEPWHIAEHYYSENYMHDIYDMPFNTPYNQPYNQQPYNGIVMPPQPDTIYNDFYQLGSLAQQVGSFDSCYFSFINEVDNLVPLPELDPDLSDEERVLIANESFRANTVMAYLAAVKFVDAQINRFIDSLQAYPDILNNSVIVLLSDHGFSLGEKRHWQKGTMWETDLRAPFIIADMRDTAKQLVYAPVSMLDVFPTLCDIAQAPYPAFADGTPYLDGKSLKPFIADPSTHIDKPALASYLTGRDIQCACFPQYSIRTAKFHYIVYTSNNAGDTIECDISQSWREEELYEIGEHRETDPNEWYNLIHDTAYQPLIDYLRQWLPDSAMYLQTPFTASIQTGPLNCLVAYTDTIDLSFDLYDTIGAAIIPPSGYNYIWTNNFTTDTLSGTDAEFLMSSLPDTVFESATRIVFYMQMIDTSTGATVALDTKYIYINSTNAPEISFHAIADSLTVSITDISIEGTFNNIWWDFDDGTTAYEKYPAPHTYTENGTYTISCYATYGNNETCIESASQVITPMVYAYFKDSIVFLMPGKNHVQVLNFDR